MAAMTAGAVALTAAGPAWAGDDVTRLSVRPAATLAALHAGAVGVDEPMWSPAFADPAVPGLIRRANIQTLEFNGGGVSDLYHWKTGMVPVISSNPLVVGHAVRGPGGTLAVLVQNDDPARAATVRFDVPGYHAVTALRYGNTDPAPHPAAAGEKLPAYSLTLIQFRR
jgi:hypothetical protein